MNRIQNKAWAVSEAWLAHFGSRPNLNQVVLTLAVGEHESGLGDAWAADYHARNWGAAQLPWKYQLNAAERAELGSPDVAFSHAIHGPHAARPFIPDKFDKQIDYPPYQDARRFLYTDSNQGKPFWVFEAGFGTDRDAIAYMLFGVAMMRGAVTAEFMATATTDELAVAMKHNGYYGVSIGDYQIALRHVLPGIMAGLAGWDVENPTHDAGSDDPLPIPASWGGGTTPPFPVPNPVAESSSASSSLPEPSPPTGPYDTVASADAALQQLLRDAVEDEGEPSTKP
jgi:hypothetical protein